MECATVNCGYMDDVCLVLDERKPIAKKEHKCHECYRKILPGEKYLVEVLLFEGEVNRHKTCTDCVSIRENFFTDGWIYGEVQEALSEHIRDSDGDVSESCIAALTPGAREMVCDMIEELDEDEDSEGIEDRVK